MQHLESLNDQVAELTGVRVRETFPTRCSPQADEVVLIDLTPEALIERLRAGKIYPAERIDGRARTTSSGSRTSRAARGRAATGRRGRRGKRLTVDEPLGTREDALIDAAPRRSASALLALVEAAAALAAAHPPRVALGTAARAPSSTCC